MSVVWRVLSPLEAARQNLNQLVMKVVQQILNQKLTHSMDLSEKELEKVVV